jgi:hypothetical protein
MGSARLGLKIVVLDAILGTLRRWACLPPPAQSSHSIKWRDAFVEREKGSTTGKAGCVNTCCCPLKNKARLPRHYYTQSWQSNPTQEASAPGPADPTRACAAWANTGPSARLVPLVASEACPCVHLPPLAGEVAISQPSTFLHLLGAYLDVFAFHLRYHGPVYTQFIFGNWV